MHHFDVFVGAVSFVDGGGGEGGEEQEGDVKANGRNGVSEGRRNRMMFKGCQSVS